MRIAIVSDVHANLAALEAVLRHAEGQGARDGLWCLGDTVGYGPEPGECIARLRGLGATLVAGNHDRAATGKIGTEEFNPDAATAARWTARQLDGDERQYLDSLPEVVRLTAGRDRSLKAAPPEGSLQEGEFTLVHGTLRWPIWEYLYSYEVAQGHLQRQQTPFGLVGHTHVPMLVLEGEEFPNGCEMYFLEDGTKSKLERRRKLVLNPGGVGQPRDGDPRASYAVYDSDEETVTIHRVEYDIAATQKLMEAAALPRWLIDRLSVGR